MHSLICLLVYLLIIYYFWYVDLYFVWGFSLTFSCCSVTKSPKIFCDPMDCTIQVSLYFTSPGACSNSCSLNRWCYPTVSSSVVSFSSCPQSSPASGFFPMSQFFTSGGQSIGASASASVLPVNIQHWFPLGCTGLISLLSKAVSRVSSNTMVQKHQFFSIQLSSHPYLTTGKIMALTRLCW